MEAMYISSGWRRDVQYFENQSQLQDSASPEPRNPGEAPRAWGETAARLPRRHSKLRPESITYRTMTTRRYPIRDARPSDAGAISYVHQASREALYRGRIPDTLVDVLSPGSDHL